PVREEVLEAFGVEAAGLDSEQVPAGTRQQDRAGFALRQARFERPAEPGDMDLQGIPRGGRRSHAPQAVDQLIARGGLVGVEKEDREQRSLLAGAERYWTALVADLERPKDTELHRPSWPTVPQIAPFSEDPKRGWAAARALGRNAQRV